MGLLIVFVFCFLSVNVSTETMMKAQMFRKPSREYKSFETVLPRIQRPRDRRQIETDSNDTKTIFDLSITIPFEGKNIILDLNSLKPTKDLLHMNAAMMYQQNGSIVTLWPNRTKAADCEYHGKVRGDDASWVELSACGGMQGTIHHGDTSYYIEPTSIDASDVESTHYLYRQMDWKGVGVCGNTKHGNKDIPRDIIHTSENLRRKRRSSGQNTFLPEPHNANSETLYNELLLVVDKGTFVRHGGNLENVFSFCKRLVNRLNYLYIPLNIYIVLVRVIVWNDRDEIVINSNSSKTLESFLKYRKNKLIKAYHHDNAHLITNIPFANNVVGLASVGNICSETFSGGINSLPNEIDRAASILAHEIGHNFGMRHDNDVDSCACHPNSCIMNDSTGQKLPRQWSGCSRSVLVTNKAGYHCLRNKPKTLFASPTCGNGFVEPGEECDCGPVEGACARCCDVSTCRLRRNFTCASGSCCDKRTCSYLAAGTECRGVRGECDLPEFCSGESEHCPQDLTKMDSTSCAEGKAFCYQGLCQYNTHYKQCRQLWGSLANSDMSCYQKNHLRSKYSGNNKDDHITIEDNAYCGRLQCQIASNGVKPLVSAYIYSYKDASRSGHYCYQVRGHPLGTVANGAVCGLDKMCLDQKCVEVKIFRQNMKHTNGHQCTSSCSGHGVCNSAGECHCERGFAPPDCTKPRARDSLRPISVYEPKDETSLQAKDQHAVVKIALFAVFLGIVPLVIIVFVLYRFKLLHKSKNNKISLCCTATYKRINILNILSQTSSRLSERIFSRNRSSIFQGNSKRNASSTVPAQPIDFKNASQKEIKIMNGLMSTLVPNDQSKYQDVLQKTFNFDFKTVVEALRENEHLSKQNAQSISTITESRSPKHFKNLVNVRVEEIDGPAKVSTKDVEQSDETTFAKSMTTNYEHLEKIAGKHHKTTKTNSIANKNLLTILNASATNKVSATLTKQETNTTNTPFKPKFSESNISGMVLNKPPITNVSIVSMGKETATTTLDSANIQKSQKYQGLKAISNDVSRDEMSNQRTKTIKVRIYNECPPNQQNPNISEERPTKQIRPDNDLEFIKTLQSLRNVSSEHKK